MKPFKINRNSWHYKLNKHFFNDNGHMMEGYWEPRHNSFCDYWRITVIRIIFSSALTFVLGGILFMIGTGVVQNPMMALFVVLSMFAFFAVIGGIIFISVVLEDRKRNSKKPESLAYQKYRAYKDKICPIVEFQE